jgi:hypothetical protein
LKQFPERFVRIPIDSIVSGKNQQGGGYYSHDHEADVRHVSSFLQEARNEEIKVKVYTQCLENDIEKKLDDIRRMKEVIENAGNTPNGQGPGQVMIKKPKWYMVKLIPDKPMAL